jgi:phosphate transport system permease protein
MADRVEPSANLAARIEARRRRRKVESAVMRWVLFSALAIVIGGLALILIVTIVQGLPAISWSMLSEVPNSNPYAKDRGGILNAIVGSLYLAVGGTGLCFLLGLPVALYLNAYAGRSRFADWVRLALDFMWGIPSLIYGVFAFTIMMAVGLKASLLIGMITLALVELPILTRGIDEVLRLIPHDLYHNTLALGATRWELMGMLARQAIPGIFTSVLLAFGRGIGDAAAVLITAGYTDRLPGSILEPAASLPLTVFYQLSMPGRADKAKAYAAALVLTVLVLGISLLARVIASRLGRYVVR